MRWSSAPWARLRPGSGGASARVSSSLRQRIEGQCGIAPIGAAHRREAVILDRLHEGRLQGLAAAGGAEAAVREVAPGAARDLRHFGGGQHPRRATVELAAGRERDMIQVQVEPHADGIRRHQAVHLAGLVERHLGVARARAQRPEHHRAPALDPAHALGERVDRFGREGDDRVARLEAGQLAMPLVRQGGEPGAAGEARLGHERADQRAHRVRAEEHGLRRAARPQQAVGEDMTALAVAGELYLVHGDEFDRPVQRHRFDRADEVARFGGDPLLLPRHQGDGVRPLGFDHPVVDLAREEAEGKAHRAGAMRQHALDRQVGLARVGRTEQRGDGRAVGVVPNHGRRIRGPARFGNPVRRSLGHGLEPPAGSSHIAPQTVGTRTTRRT